MLPTPKDRSMEQVSADAVPRQALTAAAPYVFSGGQVILSGRPKGSQLREAIMAHIERAPEESVTPLDVSAISFMDVSCADEMLNKLLLRIGSGELGGRFLYLEGANASLRETIEAVLQLRELAALLKTAQGPVVLGQLKRPLREALDVVLRLKSVTSAEMTSQLNKNVNIVCNRLNALQRMGLVCRMRDLSVIGGGRQYYYVSLL